MRRPDVLCLVLGGGRGTRLDPLTRYRAKPAVPVGGKFRLVDVPISNSLNSDIRRIMVLTQFNSASLNTHIARTYQFDLFNGGFVRVLAADQTDSHKDWFQGTADAVRRALPHMSPLALSQASPFAPRDVLILSGDQLYRMDFGPLIRQHRDSGADVTVAAQMVTEDKTSGFGLMRTGEDRRLVSFLEKPQDPSMLAGYEAPDDMLEEGAEGQRYPASMGIYVFRFDVLVNVLQNSQYTDFGHEVLPAMVGDHDVRAYPFHGYWEDIGTIRAFYEAMIELALPEPPFRFQHRGGPIYTEPRILGATRIEDCRVRHSMICDGCGLRGTDVESSVIGIRTIVRSDTRISRSVVMGADIYEDDYPRVEGVPPIGIGRDCEISGAIIDKNARIGDGVRISPKPPGTHADHENFCVRDGIVVIPKGAVLPDGTQI